MTFGLDGAQVDKFVKWRNGLEDKHKKFGKYRFEFSYNSGIGEVVKVKSDLAKKKLDLTEYEKW